MVLFDLSSCIHYFDDPAVIPRVSVLWKIRKKMRVGSSDSSEAAASWVTSRVFWPLMLARAIGSVCDPGPVSMTIGIRNSFHVQTKKKTTRTDRVGRIIGKTTLHKVLHFPAPSTIAASRTSRGNEDIAEERRYVPNAAWRTVKMMTTDHTEL